MIPRILFSFILVISLAATLPAQTEKLPSPAELCSKMKLGLVKAKAGCVALSAGGGKGSAVVISSEGLVLTAAHMATRIKEGKFAKITYEDGTTAEVEALGWNIGTDIALFKIITPSENPWPHVELAAAAPLTGSFCFTFAHPSGKLKGRPAQVRIGRIVSHSIKGGKTCLLTADCNIQPGDSGGGLFSLDGKLIGINSSAANIVGFNFFPAIDQYYLDRKRLLNKERWGDIADRPDSAKRLKLKVTKEMLSKVQTELMRRTKLGYTPALDFILQRRQPDGTVKLNPRELVQFMTREAISYGLGQPVSLGLDDPALVKQLKLLSKEHTRALPIYDDKKRLCFGLALNKQHVITKASLLKGHTALSIRFGGKTIPVTILTADKKWDLAIVRLKNKLPLPVIMWPSEPVEIEAGDLLVAPDFKGRSLWGNATDERRVVSETRSAGPIDKSLISKHRGPYPMVIRHSIPLFAANAGSPVFDENGAFVGMHIARFSRTMALVIPSEELHTISKSMLEKKAASTK